jgi:hypothetical protein
MTETKFTRGPWLYRGKSDSVHKPSDTHPYGERIFRFHDEEGPNDADLELILAAPDLYAALAECFAVIAGDEGLEIDFPDEYERLTAMARAALAKASGEQ